MLIIQQPARLPLPGAAGPLVAQPPMIAFFRKWRRNKSLLRSSSSGPCYPYPRSHSTVMVVPSNRPLPSEEQEKKKPQPRRRPPLNRAIPTIPESKSNESIMSHASRVSTTADPTASTSGVDCVVIENRSAVERFPPVSKRDTAAMRREEVAKEKTTPRSPLLTVAHTMREKLSKLTRRKSPASSTGVKSSQSFSGFRGAPPAPPPVDENSNRVIKSSSMEVTLVSDRPTTSKKVVIPQLPDPLCGDESSETLEPSTTLPPSDSAVVKVSMKADVLTVTEVSAVPPPVQALVEETLPATGSQEQESMSDVTATGTSNTTVIVTERPKELPVTVVYKQEHLESTVVRSEPEPKKDDNKENSCPETKQVTTTLIIHTKKVEEVKPRPQSPEKSKSPERFVMTVKTPESQKKHRAFVVGERVPEEVLVEEAVEVYHLEKTETVPARPCSPEKAKSPERYVMTVKTPEARRKHRTFVIGEREPEAVMEHEEVKETKAEFPMRESIREETKSPERYIMTVKSPEPQKKHRVFMVGQKSEEAVVAVEEELEVGPVRQKTKKSKSVSRESSMSPERYILTIKTPETLRKHRVLTIGEGAPKERKIIRSRSEERPTLKIWTSLRKTWALRRTQTFSSADVGAERPVVEKRISFAERKPREEPKPQEPREKFVMVCKTPQTLRRHHTFMVGERPRTPDYPWIEEGEITEPIATVGPSAVRAQKMREKRTRSEEPRSGQKEEGGERFVITTRTPLAMRKYQTFVVESTKQPQPLPTSVSADVGEAKRRGDELLKELDAIYPISSRLESREFSSSLSKEIYPFSQESPRRMTTSEMYSLCSTTTPQLRRREEVSSPTLFVLNKRSERPLEDERTLEAVKEVSQSDKADLKSPSLDDLTSLEDEIPMDTAAEERSKPVVAVLPLTSRPVPSPKAGRKKKKGSAMRNGQDHRLLRGLRSAGRIFFLNKKRTPPPSSTLSQTVSSCSITRRAPLAQSESSVVANSPLVENLPIEAWNIARPRVSPPRAYAALIREESHDANGNPQQEDGCPGSPQLEHRGLIDDEILDQPMLVGDSFSHSESSDLLSERATGPVEQQQRRADVAPTQHTPPVRSENTADDGLAQVADIRNKLKDLQTLINSELGNEHRNESSSLDVSALARENDCLRRQLIERDQLIAQLREQLATSMAQLHPLPV